MNDTVDSPPLRALKKQRTAQALRTVARDYFKRVPFDEARLTDIARDAEVSASTVYNYFSTKLELLYAVIQEDELEIVAKAKKLHARKWSDAVAAIDALARLFFRWFDSYQRTALQALLAAAFVSRSKEHDNYVHFDEINVVTVTELITALQRQRLVDPALDTSFVGGLVFNLINAEFFNFVGDEGRSVEASSASLRRQLEFVAPIWTPKRSAIRYRPHRA
jgi:AcrR family transcriptional regulator